MKKVTILCLTLVMILGVLPAFAQDKADWTFYGSVRVWTSWEHWDKDAPVNSSGASIPNYGSPSTKRSGNWLDTATGNRFDDGDLWWGTQVNSRIGANVKWGNVGGRFEYGHFNAEGSSTGADTTHMRLLYGNWDFGPGVLRIGQDYTPYYFTVSSECGPSNGDCGGLGWATLYGGRKDQIKLIFGGLQISALRGRVWVNL